MIKGDIKRIKRITFYIVCIVAFVVMCQNFATNCFGIVEKDWFDNWQEDSEWSVRQRMIDDDRFGFGHNSGLLGDWSPKPASGQRVYDENHGAYTIQVGLQGMLFGLVYKMTHSFEVARWLEVILFVICIFALLKWLKDEFGTVSAIFLYFLILYNNWLIVSARNMYWTIWLFILPMLLLLFYLRYEEKKGRENFKIIVLIEFLAIFVKCACGYEFVSLVMINMEVPLFYYMVKNNWGIKKMAKRFFALAAAALLGFATAFIVCLFQAFTYFDRQWEPTIASFTWRIAYRTGIGDTDAFTGIVLESLNASKYDVLTTYFENGIPLIWNMRMDRLIIWILVGIALTLAAGSISRRIAVKRKELFALVVMCAVSFLGPLSWFILASPHSYIHTHICYMLWSLPFLILGETIFVTTMIYLFVDVYEKIKFYLFVPVLIGMGIVAYLYYNNYSYAINTEKSVKVEGLELYNGPSMKIYLYKDTLFYIDSNKKESEKRISLNFITSDTEAEDLLEDGFIVRDFSFDSCKMEMPFWYSGKIAVIPLPSNYFIEEIKTGQYENDTVFWQTSIELFDKLDDLWIFVVCNLTDDNWNHGFNRKENIIIVESRDASFEYLDGKRITLSDGSVRTITDVRSADNYYYLYVDEYISIDSDYVTIQVDRTEETNLIQ